MLHRHTKPYSTGWGSSDAIYVLQSENIQSKMCAFWACFCNLISQNVRIRCIPEVQQFWMRMTGRPANTFVYKPIQNCNFCQPESSMLLLTIIWRLHGAVVAIILQCCWLWCSSLINSMQCTYVSWTISSEICFLQQEKGWDSRAVEKGKELITVLLLSFINVLFMYLLIFILLIFVTFYVFWFENSVEMTYSNQSHG